MESSHLSQASGQGQDSLDNIVQISSPLYQQLTPELSDQNLHSYIWSYGRADEVGSIIPRGWIIGLRWWCSTLDCGDCVLITEIRMVVDGGGWRLAALKYFLSY